MRTGDSFMPKIAPSRATTTSTSGSQNSQCHDRCSTIGPAATMPTPAPTPKIADSRPTVTLTLSRGSSSRTMPIDSGRIAPAEPCSTRATMSTTRFGASAASRVPDGEGGQHADEHAALADHVAEPAEDRGQHRGGEQVRGEHPADVGGGRRPGPARAPAAPARPATAARRRRGRPGTGRGSAARRRCVRRRSGRGASAGVARLDSSTEVVMVVLVR